MKIKTIEKTYEEVLNLPKEKRLKPHKPGMFVRKLLKTLSAGELKQVHFTYQMIGMERLGAEEPCLILMNHSSFIDLKIAATVLYPRPLNIVCTSDGFVGKAGLMQKIGCIPTCKFVSDMALVQDLRFCVKQLKSSILMYPEASYSFDGTATPLPDSLGKLIKILKVPVVMIRTYGAFARDPLYNNLRLRNVPVSADVEYFLSPEEIATASAEALNARLAEGFSFDNFRWQQENGVRVEENFRAEGLNRVLYKCPHCLTEGKMIGRNATLSCTACARSYRLTEEGFLEPQEGFGATDETKFTHIPDWYRWERECVRGELQSGKYRLDVPVKIYMLVDTKAVYQVGCGRLVHDENGFVLDGCDGKLHYVQKPLASYSLYSDYYWYEIGDMICIGDQNTLYYCFPESDGDIVAKTRLAAEELYRIKKRELLSPAKNGTKLNDCVG